MNMTRCDIVSNSLSLLSGAHSQNIPRCNRCIFTRFLVRKAKTTTPLSPALFSAVLTVATDVTSLIQAVTKSVRFKKILNQSGLC